MLINIIFINLFIYCLGDQEELLHHRREWDLVVLCLGMEQGEYKLEFGGYFIQACLEKFWRRIPIFQKIKSNYHIFYWMNNFVKILKLKMCLKLYSSARYFFYCMLSSLPVFFKSYLTMGHFHLLEWEGIIFPFPRGKRLTEVWGHHTSGNNDNHTSVNLFSLLEWKYHSFPLRRWRCHSR